MTRESDFQLPRGWIWTRIGEISESIQYGTSEKARKDVEGIPVLRMGNIQEGKISFEDLRYFPSTWSNLNHFVLQPGDVLFNRTNSAELVGKSAVYEKHHPRAVFASYLIRIRTNADFCSPHILAYFINSLYGRKYIASVVSQQVGQANVNGRKLSQMPILLIPRNEQSRILAKIENSFALLEAGVGTLQKVKTQLKRYRQAVLKYAFEGKLTEKWRKARKDRIEQAQVLLEKIEKKRISRNPQWKSTEPINPKDLPEIPNDWIWVRAQDVCENITNGYTPSASELHASKGEIPFIKINNLTFTGKLDFSKNKTFIDTKVHETLLKRSKVFPGDILINIVGPPLGKVSIVPNLYPEWNINQAIVFFRPIEGYDGDFLSLCLQTRTITSHLTDQAKATAGQFNISVNMSRNLPIPLPSQEEQKEIVLEVTKHLDAMESAEIALCNSLSKADYLRNSILKSAFLGRLVPQDQNDEPAEKLLERIKAERIKRHSEGSASSSHRKLEIDNQVELSSYVK